MTDRRVCVIILWVKNRQHFLYRLGEGLHAVRLSVNELYQTMKHHLRLPLQRRRNPRPAKMWLLLTRSLTTMKRTFSSIRQNTETQTFSTVRRTEMFSEEVRAGTVCRLHLGERKPLGVESGNGVVQCVLTVIIHSSRTVRCAPTSVNCVQLSRQMNH